MFLPLYSLPRHPNNRISIIFHEAITELIILHLAMNCPII